MVIYVGEYYKRSSYDIISLWEMQRKLGEVGWKSCMWQQISFHKLQKGEKSMKKKLEFLENLKTQMIRNEYENIRQIFSQETSKYEEKFEKGETQRQLSKEFVRQWLIEHNFMNEPGQTMPEITDDYAISVSERYIELFEQITGEKFSKAADTDDIAARIEKNVTDCLASL